MVHMYDGLAANTIDTTETEIVGSLIDGNLGVEDDVATVSDDARLDFYRAVDALYAVRTASTKNKY